MLTRIACRSAGTAALALVLALPRLAWADFKVFSPIVEQGELEVEHNGDITFDKNPGKRERSFTDEIGYGVNSWWMPELELETDHQPAPGERLRMTAFTLENTFQLTDQGEYWADYGFFAEYSKSLQQTLSDAVTFGPLIQKQIGRTLHTANLFLTKGIGSNQNDPGFQFSYAWQSRWMLYKAFEPGFEIYGQPGRVDHIDSFQNQPLRMGPVAVGIFSLEHLGNLRYEAGYLPGVTRGAANGTLRWQLEWEMPL